MRVLKLVAFIILIIVLVISITAGKCAYDAIDEVVLEGKGYGFEIGSDTNAATGRLVNIPNLYPTAMLYKSDGMSSSTAVDWNSIDQANKAATLMLIYDTQSNYLDFLSFKFTDGELTQMHRMKFCALNPEYNRLHRIVVQLISVLN